MPDYSDQGPAGSQLTLWMRRANTAPGLADCLSGIVNSASTVRLPDQGGNLSGKHVLSPSDDNGLPGLATIRARILRQPV